MITCLIPSVHSLAIELQERPQRQHKGRYAVIIGVVERRFGQRFQQQVDQRLNAFIVRGRKKKLHGFLKSRGELGGRGK